jgi:hypothetical protein
MLVIHVHGKWRSERSWFKASLDKKLARSRASQPIGWVWWCTPVIPAMRSKNRIMVQPCLGINVRLYWRNN